MTISPFKDIMVVWEEGYNNYKAFEHFTIQKTGFVTRIKDNASYLNIEKVILASELIMEF